MNTTKLNRRDFLQRAAVLGAAAVAGSALVSACKSGGGEGGGGGLSCTNTAGLSAAEIQTRTQFNYVDQTPDASQPCTACALWLPAGEGECGGCTLVKGPINPNGWCSSFAARPS